MNYINFRQKLAEFPIFSLQDARKVWPTLSALQLSRWQKKEYIMKIRRGYYLFSDVPHTEQLLWYISNKIYQPSYISFELALSYYHLIPESVYAITSATTQKTARYVSPLGNFVYHHLRAPLFFGYAVIQLQDRQPILMAEMEKALLDYLYINTHIRTADDMASLRLNAEELKEQLDQTKLDRYLQAFHQQALSTRVQMLLNTIYADAQSN